MIWFKFEKALKLLMSHFPEEPMKKPTLFHSLRVGTYLWNHNYSEDLQIAGLFHDALEDTPISEEIISNHFGENVLNIVKANSKNKQLDKSEILEDIVHRCSLGGEPAMIVKMADVYDNFLFYQKEGNISEIDRCKTLAKLIEAHLKSEWKDQIFRRTTEILEYKN